MGDITPLFESYHTLSNKEYIRKHLEDYKIEGSSESSYDFKLYDELSNRIKTNYKLKRTNMKATLQKQVYVMIMLTGYIVLTYIFLFDLHFTLEIILGTLLGLIWISLGFNVMHDASHSAFFTNLDWTIMLPNFGTLFLHGTIIFGSTIIYCLITVSQTLIEM